MCEPDKRKGYSYCQETKLVRVVLEHIAYNPDYKECVGRLLSSISLKKEIEIEDDWAGSGAPDFESSTAEHSFNDE